jgi:hypothetical protein
MLQDNYTPTKNLGNGTTTVFSFGFALLAEANIRVYLEDATTGVQTLQTRGTDYTVTTWGRTGGTITMTSAPSSSYYVVIARDISKTQEVNFETSSGFQGEVVENDADKAVALVQDLAEKINRALLYPLGTDSSQTRVLPTVSTDAGYIYYDGSAYSIIDALTGTGDYPADITRGTDASKAATPSVGDIHVATDTSILYICFTAGTWTDYNQSIKERNKIQNFGISQTNETASDSASVGSSTWTSQSFTPNTRMIASSVILLYKNLVDAELDIRIETDNDGYPSGTLVDGFTQADDVTGVATGVSTEREYSFGQTVVLEGGNRYWLRMRTSDVGTNDYSTAGEDIMSGEGWRIGTGELNTNDLYMKIGLLGLSAGNCVKYVDEVFETAKADTEANSNRFVGIVESVENVSYYELTTIVFDGFISSQTGLTRGSLYYLDPATAGAYTATKPTGEGQYVKPVMIATSETTGIVINQVGIEVVASTTDMVFFENSAVGYENEVVYNQ